VDRKTLIGWSIAADVLDVIAVGQIPGLSWFIDIPILLLHVAFAGPKGFFTLLEMIPVVGTIPLFTISAFVQEKK
jgi:hypothetical protein